MDNKSIIEKVKELVKKGNVSHIVVRRNADVILNIPVNVGVVGGVVALAAAKWVLLASVLATVGFGCTVEIVKDDGEIVNVVSEENNQKVRAKAADIVGGVKSAIGEKFSKAAAEAEDAAEDIAEDIADEIVFEEENKED